MQLRVSMPKSLGLRRRIVDKYTTFTFEVKKHKSCNILILCPLFTLFQNNVHSIFSFLWWVFVFL